MNRRAFFRSSLAVLGVGLFDGRDLAQAVPLDPARGTLSVSRRVERALAEGATIPTRRLGRTNPENPII